MRERTFVILGTSHYGQPDRFGLTRKAFATPFGETGTNLALVDEIARAAGDGALMEDYCHAVEHSIEFQVVFLQHLFGPSVRVVPVLCGAFSRGMQAGAQPEDDEAVRRTIGALGEIAAREGDRLLWVLGVDMAHMGRRYGDRFEAAADRGEMEDVARRDRSRIERMEQGDAAGFWEQVRENRRRSEVVRILADLHVLARDAGRPRQPAALSAVEHRSAERGQFRRNAVPLLGTPTRDRAGNRGSRFRAPTARPAASSPREKSQRLPGTTTAHSRFSRNSLDDDLPAIERRRRGRSDLDQRPVPHQRERSLPVRQRTAHDEMIVAVHENPDHGDQACRRGSGTG